MQAECVDKLQAILQANLICDYVDFWLDFHGSNPNNSYFRILDMQYWPSYKEIVGTFNLPDICLITFDENMRVFEPVKKKISRSAFRRPFLEWPHSLIDFSARRLVQTHVRIPTIHISIYYSIRKKTCLRYTYVLYFVHYAMNVCMQKYDSLIKYILVITFLGYWSKEKLEAQTWIIYSRMPFTELIHCLDTCLISNYGPMCPFRSYNSWPKYSQIILYPRLLA